jgi:hypothetical protein
MAKLVHVGTVDKNDRHGYDMVAFLDGKLTFNGGEVD